MKKGVRIIFPQRQLDAYPSTWQLVRLGGLDVLQSALLASHSVVHAFTLRPDDLLTTSGAPSQRALQRRERLCRALGGTPARMFSMEQVHGSRIAVAGPMDPGGQLDGADGVATDQPSVTVLALSADCPLVLVCDPGRPAFGLVHAGWRGTLAGITRRLIRTMIDELHCSPDRMVAAISPSAGPCCYEVGQDVIDQAAGTLPDYDACFHPRDNRVYFDLWAANVAQLRAAGLAAERIDLAASCTICDNRFFSYRRDGAATGHAGLLATLARPALGLSGAP